MWLSIFNKVLFVWCCINYWYVFTFLCIFADIVMLFYFCRYPTVAITMWQSQDWPLCGPMKQGVATVDKENIFSTLWRNLLWVEIFGGHERGVTMDLTLVELVLLYSQMKKSLILRDVFFDWGMFCFIVVFLSWHSIYLVICLNLCKLLLFSLFIYTYKCYSGWRGTRSIDKWQIFIYKVTE